ncbi:Crossover junction endodeoxyribonuclease RuvC [Frankia canadensis]|uniref:Crossover junction endodeoxyribonuclease RuvC n=1 Tax=Frankia canadensis TaxID=1836972 RepID=A0A2I2KYL3_9ACTN|nr:crossover junction endodeoxyribonuclease RuvC [Frankia canadensis]SNQ50748.1 Crossover junction endodeoxyribonuclease RuvC [Frankia canadensis]SOU58038.1 Crossover junction endodeoxyribonuclease RuvC [Frankia canadensis]
MRVLGVDPGLTRCGLGVIDGALGMRASLVEVGVVRTPAGVEVPERLRAIADGIDAWLDRTRPEAVAVEKVFSQANVRTVMGTAQAGAVAITLAARRGLPVGLYTPSEVKAAVTGSGRADKAQVGFMISKLLGLSEVPRPADAADALALALCHLWRGPALARMRAAAGGGAAPGTRAAGAARILPGGAGSGVAG